VLAQVWSVLAAIGLVILLIAMFAAGARSPRAM
jgi:hypothetical protein